jgi:uncharacterized protein (DUF2384 family)
VLGKLIAIIDKFKKDDFFELKERIYRRRKIRDKNLTQENGSAKKLITFTKKYAIDITNFAENVRMFPPITA